MGKTKTKIIDDSIVEAPTTPEPKVKKLGIKIAKPVAVKKVETEPEIAQVEATKAKKSSSKPIQGKEKPRSKKYQAAALLIDKSQVYPIKEAIELSQKAAYWKNSGALEIHINTNIKNIRGLILLPFASGKKLRVLAFGKGAKEAGADIEGTEETISAIEKGKIDFDIVVATPDWMPKLAKVARVLGPRGLMPNPKNETVTDNLAKAIKELQSGKTEYKTEANGQVIHLGVGKTTAPVEEIYANIKALYNTIGRSKITKITLSSTMGPGVKVNLSSI